MSRTITILTVCIASAACSKTTEPSAALSAPPTSSTTQPSSVPTARGGGPSSIDGVLSTGAAWAQIAETRCQQIERCGGSSAKLYDSHDHCVTEYESRLDGQAQLSCAAGIDAAALTACLDQLAVCSAAQSDGWPRLCRPYRLCFLP